MHAQGIYESITSVRIAAYLLNAHVRIMTSNIACKSRSVKVSQSQSRCLPETKSRINWRSGPAAVATNLSWVSLESTFPKRWQGQCIKTVFGLSKANPTLRIFRNCVQSLRSLRWDQRLTHHNLRGAFAGHSETHNKKHKLQQTHEQNNLDPLGAEECSEFSITRRTNPAYASENSSRQTTLAYARVLPGQAIFKD